MKKQYKIFTALLLVITLALQFSVFATAQGKEATDDGTDIVYEIPEFRKEFEKHFQMSDGTVVASTYAEPVNYYDSTDNTWKEIDNTLTQEDGRYKNKGHGGFNVSFRGDGTSGDLVEMSDGGYTLSWSVSVQNEYGEKNGLKQQVNASVKQRENTENDKFAADKAGSGMRYNSPFGGNKIINVDYTVSQHKVKEDITIYSQKDANVVYYTYNCPSLTAVLTEDNSILFVNSENETVFTVHTPYMYDSAGNGSYEFDISLQQRGDICTVVMVPDKEWLSSPERVYPVVIDPTTTTGQATANIVDTYVHQGDAAGDHYSETSMVIGLKNGVVHKGLIKFLSYPSINTPIAEVKYAKLSLSLTGGTTAGGFSVYRLRGAWDDETVSYSNYPSSIEIASNVYPYFGTMKLEFDITSFYLDYAGTSSDYGLMVRYTDTTYNDYNSFHTSEYSDSAVRPVIIVAYDLTNETESNNDFATADELVIDPYPGTITPISGTHSSSNTTVDYDYFKFTSPRHGRVEVTLKVNGGGFGITYYLDTYDQSGTLLASGSVLTYSDGSGTYSGYTEVNFTVTKDGNLDGSLDTYYIRVYGTAGSTASYRVTVKYTTQYASLGWRYPLPTTCTDTSSVIGSRYSSSEGVYKYHEGLDFPTDPNEDIPTYAVTKGYVHRSKYDSSMGEHVTLYTAEIINNTVGTKWETDPFDTSAPFVITYMHLYSRAVNQGDTVERGTVLGIVGTTGQSTGDHLHLGIYSHPSVPTQMTAYTPDDVINPYDFFYNSVAYSDIPY